MKIREILFLLVCMFGALWVQAKDPWGLMDNYVDPHHPGRPGNGYLMPKVLAGLPIYVKVNRDSEIVNRRYEEIGAQISHSYNKWFSNAVQYIEKQHREEEFADILPVLRRGVNVQLTEQTYYDIHILFLPAQEVKKRCQNEYALGCYQHGFSIIYLPTDDLFTTISLHKIRKKGRIGLHEIGHSLGLSDQYLGARVDNSDERYSSMQERKSVMNRSGSLTCDDADGIVNLIDVTQSTYRGGEQGWKSFCVDSQEYYVGGIPAGKGPYQLRLTPDMESVEVVTYQGTERIASKYYPFDIPKEARSWKETPAVTYQEFDRLKRPVQAQGPNGETIYYNYLYDRTIRVAVKDGKVLNYVEQQRVPKKYKGSYRNLLFGQKGAVSRLYVQKRGKRAFHSKYVEGVNRKTVTLLLERNQDDKGQINEEYQPDGRTPMVPPANGNSEPNLLTRKIAQQIETQTQDEQHKRLVQQLDAWSRQTLKELEDSY